MLKLNRRDCHIGNSINTRTEFHGEEPKQAMDIPITFMCDRGELNSLLRDPTASERFFNEVNGVFEPAFAGKIKGPLALLGHFENSNVIFRCGLNLEKIEVAQATVSFKIDPSAGGMTMVKATVSALQTEEMKALYTWMESNQKVDIRVGKITEVKTDDQKSLPLGEAAPVNKVAAALEREEAGLADYDESVAMQVAATAKPKRKGRGKNGAEARP